MSDDFNRKSFKVGLGGYDVLKQPPEGEAEQDDGKEKSGDGRGEAMFSGDPRIIDDGSELARVAYTERAEEARTASIAQRMEQHNGGSSLAAGLVVGAMLASEQDRQDQPQQFPPEVRQEIEQPSPEHQGRASLHSLKAEQAATAIPKGLEAYVDEASAQEVARRGAELDGRSIGTEQAARPSADLSAYVDNATVQEVASRPTMDRSRGPSLTL